MPQSKRKQRNVQVINRCKRLQNQATQVCSLFHFLDNHIQPETIPDGELSVAFVDEKEIRRLHEKYFNDPHATDVITFQGDPKMDFAGEICVSIDFAEHYVSENGFTLAREITLYLVHGWLHLAGHEDKSVNGRDAIRQAENKIMEALDKSNKIPPFAIS